MTKEQRAQRFQELAEVACKAYGWSTAQLAKEGLGVPSQHLYRYLSAARGKDSFTRAPSKGMLRAVELLIQVHEQQQQIAALEALIEDLKK